jgi:hypothetical protein
MFYLKPPRHISTLPNSEVGLLSREVGLALNNGLCQKLSACLRTYPSLSVYRLCLREFPGCVDDFLSRSVEPRALDWPQYSKRKYEAAQQGG